MMKRTVIFTLGIDRASVTVEVHPRRSGGLLMVDLQPAPADACELSITGEVDGHSGQCTERMAELAAECDAPDVARLCAIWDRWHLNGLRAGTALQMEALENMPPLPAGGDRYKAAKAFLAEAGLDPDTITDPMRDEGYSYGSAWLYEPLPGDIEAELGRILDRIGGQRFGAEVTEDDLADLPDVDESADFIDSRDVIKRLEGYAAFLADLPEDQRTPEAYDPETDPHGDRSDAVEEYAALKALDDEASGYAGDWRHGETMIAESHFEDYAEEFAEDIGAIARDATWPNNHINWTAAAEELKTDYTAIGFKGRTFWVR